VNGSRGVFGIGAAVSFVNSSPRNKSLIKRSVISTEFLFLLIPSYGSFPPGHDGWRFKLIFIDSLWK
jgi:hypothetical protein